LTRNPTPSNSNNSNGGLCGQSSARGNSWQIGCDSSQEVLLDTASCHNCQPGGLSNCNNNIADVALCGMVAEIQVPHTGSQYCPTAKDIFYKQGNKWPPDTNEWGRAFWSLQNNQTPIPCQQSGSGDDGYGFANKIKDSSGNWVIDLSYANSTQAPKVSSPLTQFTSYGSYDAIENNKIAAIAGWPHCTSAGGCGSDSCLNCSQYTGQTPSILGYSACPAS